MILSRFSCFLDVSFPRASSYTSSPNLGILNILFLTGVQKHSVLDFTAVVVILDMVFVIFVLAHSSRDFAVIFVIFRPDFRDSRAGTFFA